MIIGLAHAGEREGPHRETGYSPTAFQVPSLVLDGTFTLDPEERSATDPRNPPPVVFHQMEYFSFYADRAGVKPHAEECRFVYARHADHTSRPGTVRTCAGARVIATGH
jgi:hypothetical protein